MNALGAAAACSRKFYILCMRILQTYMPYLNCKKAFLLPIAVVTKQLTVDAVGLNPVLEHLRPPFEQLSTAKGYVRLYILF